MKRLTKIAIAAGAALALGLAAVTVNASPFGDGAGWHMGGRGSGAGYAMGPGMMYGYGMGEGGHMGAYSGLGPGTMGGYGPGYGMGPGALYGGRLGSVDDNLAALKSQLGITEQQESAWQEFANTAKQQSANQRQRFETLQNARSREEFYAQQQRFLQQRQTEFEANRKALDKLYAALTPEQKQFADQSFGGYGPGHCLQGWGA